MRHGKVAKTVALQARNIFKRVAPGAEAVKPRESSHTKGAGKRSKVKR